MYEEYPSSQKDVNELQDEKKTLEDKAKSLETELEVTTKNFRKIEGECLAAEECLGGELLGSLFVSD